MSAARETPALESGPSVGETLAGCTIIRRWGRGRHSTIYLGADDDSGEGSLLLKVYGAPEESAAYRTLEVASRCRSDHLMLPIDVSMEDSALCLICRRVEGTTLHDVTRDGQALLPGEIVTVLVCLLRALRSLHRAAFSHGGLVPSSLLITESGRPVLTRLSTVQRLDETEPEHRAEMVAADLRQCSDLLVTLVGDQPLSAELSELLDEAQGGRVRADWLRECERRLFEWSAPAPLRGVREGRHDSIHGARETEARRALTDTTASVREPQRREDAGAPEAEASSIVRVATVVRRIIETVRSGAAARLGRKKRVLWFCVALCGGLVALACALLPPGDPTEAADVSATGAAAAPDQPVDAADSSDQDSSADDEAAGERGPERHDSAPEDDSADALDDDSDQPVTGDDPIKAAAHLLRRRGTCFERQSLACLDAVDQAGSSALDEDRSAVAAPNSDAFASREPSSDDLRLVDRSGDSALIQLDADADDRTASLLIVRGEAGWLIRDIFRTPE